MILVTFHSGNVRSYSDDGAPVCDAVLDPEPEDAELRAISVAADGRLWVVNGSKKRSEILAYERSGSTYVNPTTIVEYTRGTILWHPFDLTFGPAGCIYVSNQRTNVVARFTEASGNWVPATSPAVEKLAGEFLDGTFVASASGDLPGVLETTPVDEKAGGLAVAFDSTCTISHSVRGVLWVDPALYVADEPGNVVRVYDADGVYLGCSDAVEEPVHLLASGGQLLVSGQKGVYMSELAADAPAKLAFGSKPFIALDYAAGMAVDKKGRLWVAQRKPPKGEKPLILRYPKVAPSSPMTIEVAPSPEFVLYVPDG